ncbi:MAG TPA: hypothetical protein VN363_05455 [Anaerolineales bacterium]|nr:hypothetical protein [Anaerolineales bacterium]
MFLVLGYAIWRDWSVIRSFEWGFNPLNLLAYVIFHTISLGCMFAGWHLTMKRLAGRSNLRTDFRIYSLSLLARHIPLPIWFVGSRVVLYQAEDIPPSIPLTATALEHALLAFGGVVCYLSLLPWYAYTQRIPWIIPVSLLVFFLAVFFIRPGLLIDLINKIQNYRHKPNLDVVISRRDLTIWGLLYLAPWFLDGIGFYFALTTFLPLPNQVVSFIGISTVSTLVAMLTMILPAGFGLKELTMGAMLGTWLPVSAGIVLSLVYRLLITLVETFWAWFGQSNTDGLPAEHSSPVN